MRRLTESVKTTEGIWHFTLAWLFGLNGLAYVLYVGFSGEWRHLLLRRNSLREALQAILHGLGMRGDAMPRSKFNAAQRLAYTSVIRMDAENDDYYVGRDMESCRHLHPVHLLPAPPR